MLGVSFLIVLLVIGFLIYVTINKGGANLTDNNMDKIEGVEITVITEGEGAVAVAGDTVSVNYTGGFEDGTTFDSNVDPKFNHVEPLSFTVGAGQVIKGWDAGVLGMKVGEKRNLVISPEMAYGAAGYPPVIPENSTLYFEVELLAINQ